MTGKLLDRSYCEKLALFIFYAQFVCALTLSPWLSTMCVYVALQSVACALA